MFNKFPEPIPFDERRQISQFYTKDCVVFRKNEVDECLAQWREEITKYVELQFGKDKSGSRTGSYQNLFMNMSKYLLEALPK